MEIRSIEELERLLLAEQDESKKLLVLLELNRAIQGKDYPRCAELCREAVGLAEKLEDELLLARALSQLGNSLWKLGDNVEAQIHYTRSMKIYAEADDDEGLTHVYCGLGIVHGNLSDSANSLEFFEKGAAAARRSGNHMMLAHHLGNIGHVYFAIEEHSTALRYFSQALAIDRYLGAEGLQGVANMLGGIAGILVYQGAYEEAISKLNEGLMVNERIDNQRGITVNLMNLGIAHFRAGKHADALEFLDRALTHATETHLGSFEHEIHKHLSDVYFDLGEDVEGLKHLNVYAEFRKAEKRSEVQRRTRVKMESVNGKG